MAKTDQGAKQRLTTLRVDEVSLVDNPANRRPFAVVKRQDKEGEEMGKTTVVDNPEAAGAPVTDSAEVVEAIKSLTDALSVYGLGNEGDDGDQRDAEKAGKSKDDEKKSAGLPASLRGPMSKLAQMLSALLNADGEGGAEKARGAKADEDDEDEDDKKAKAKKPKDDEAEEEKDKARGRKQDEDEEDEEEDEDEKGAKGKGKKTTKGVKGFTNTRRDQMRKAAEAFLGLYKDLDPDGFAELTGSNGDAGDGKLLSDLKEALAGLQKRMEDVEGATGVSKVKKTDGTDGSPDEGKFWGGVL